MRKVISKVYRFKIFYKDGTVDFIVCRDLGLLGCMIMEFWGHIVKVVELKEIKQ